MSFGPKLRLGVHLRPSCDDDDDYCCPPNEPSLLRQLLVACVPIVVTGFFERSNDRARVNAELAAREAAKADEASELRKRLDTLESEAALRKLMAAFEEMDVDDDDGEDDEGEGQPH